MKEAENPLKNMIRLKEQSDPSELGQNQVYNAAKTLCIFKIKALTIQMKAL